MISPPGWRVPRATLPVRVIGPPPLGRTKEAVVSGADKRLDARGNSVKENGP